MNRFTPVIPLAILLACLPSCDDGVKSNYSPQASNGAAKVEAALNDLEVIANDQFLDDEDFINAVIEQISGSDFRQTVNYYRENGDRRETEYLFSFKDAEFDSGKLSR